MAQPYLIALGAGAASALLVATVATGSVLSVPLFYLAPLPVLIAGIGWSQVAALIAASTAAIIVSLFFGAELLLAYVTGVGLPAYALSYLALMARGDDDGRRLEWFPVGRLVIAAAIAGTLAVAALIPLVASDLESYQAALKSLFQTMLTERADGLPADSDRFLDLLVAVMPPAAAVLTMMTQLGNLWLAGRIARTSQRLMRPWPSLPDMRLPRGSAALLFGALIGGALVSGFIGLIAEMLAATLIMAFGLAGLAVLHAITRGAAGRTLVLATAWLAALALGWPFLLLALLGLADSFLDIRSRFGGRRTGGPPAANDD
ncbi:DUF2232 domain-containing protein [Bosea sp. 117]|uniref:DUF2232 domain-containing protein n=1 Tax=Bosea sp. 117 TaxID=1125973 RepID=UPI00049468F1|nr:DUF2232 domain-containing protein [Bosea sp. 117]